MSKPVEIPFSKSKIAIAVALASGIPLTAGAEEAGEDAADIVEQIIVTARRREADIQDTPVSIQAFTADNIEDLDIAKFEDFADLSPSMSYISAGPGTQLMHIRGVSDGGIPHVFRTNGATTSFYLDEQPVSGRAGGAPDLHLYDIERIEVLRGPEGTYYGSASVSGTVRIITKKPNPEAFEWGADVSTGSITDGAMQYTTEAFVNVPLSDRAALRGVVWYDDSDGFIDNVATNLTYTNGATVSNAPFAGEDYNDETTKGGRVSLLVDLNDNWQATASLATQTMDTNGAWDHDPTNHGDLQVARFGPEYTDLSTDQYAFTLSGATPIGDLIYAGSYYVREDFAVNDYSSYVEYASFGGWIQQHACENFYWYGFSGCNDPSIFFESEDNSHRLSHELRLTSNADSGSRLNWIVGAFYERSWYDGYIFWEMPGINFENGPAACYTQAAGVTPLPLEWWSCPGWKGGDTDTAIYGDVSFDFTDKLTIGVGMRAFKWEADNNEGFSCGYPWEEKVYSASDDNPSDNDQTYKLNASYTVNDDLMLYFAYGEGFRRGGSNPMVTHAEVPEFYEPDYTESYEIGWKATLADKRVVLNGAVYHIDWDNFQTVLYDLLTVPFNFRRNVSGATIDGIEVDLTAQLNANWSLFGGIAYNAAELEGDFATIAREPRFVYADNGRRLAHVPEWKATANLRYDRPVGANNVYGQVSWAFTDERWNLLARQSEQTPVIMDSYTLIHLRAGWETQDGNLGVEFFINNATDERAQIFQNSGYYDPRITTNQPRTFGLRLKVRG